MSRGRKGEAVSALPALTLVRPAGNMMSGGQQGSKGQRQKATINGSLNKTGANITSSLCLSLTSPKWRGNSS
ncbi:hypothetical protein NQZ68_007710 [Dissostichus eleginoides]|nr:hypothetical protein NQZ68_007710 [Dissostichus eleginoides]